MPNREIAVQTLQSSKARRAMRDKLVGLFMLRVFAVCGGLSGCAFAAIVAIQGKDDLVRPANPPAHFALRMLMPPPPTTLRAKPAPARVEQILDDDFSLDEAAVTWARRIPDDVLEQDLARPDNGDDMLSFGPVRIRRRLVETIVRAARETGADPVLLMAIADKESSFSPAIKAQTSSATGLFQFVESTWLKVVRDFGARHGLAKEAAAIEGPPDKPEVADPAEREHILALRNDPYLSALLAAEMLNRDGGRIARSIGRDLTEGETYLTHFLGPDDATLFMEKMVDQPKVSAAKLLPKPARANRPIFFMRGRATKSLSVAAVHDKFEQMMDARIDRYATVEKMTDASAYAE